MNTILGTASSTIEPEDVHRVRAIAAALLEHRGHRACELLDLVITDETPASTVTPSRARAESAVRLAATIVNYLRGEWGVETIDHELLQALRRETGL
ncbi:hypothetical protein [Pseudomonas aeruginosa]|uniref:hypothetical protein n=1 Tax=Pseudomonas aeruginosa TaxID=287 RepID=UPI001F4A1A66|nr:hypothetical protein [Pseudomonas aeruginosa]